ncbi:MAG: glycoside hydrolase family 43 protein [Eubacteriales bacterium]|nr:glycoside hydrolase family 43 protein [Eubacteriales bacterium]
MSAYLFVHFKEKKTPDGEQIYFSLSRDGVVWEEVNAGQPVLWAYFGDKGVRDHTIVRNRFDGKYHIFATDLSLAYGMRGKYHHDWQEISRNGSKCLSHWESEDLVHWSEQELVKLGDDSFGCLWAPDIVFDREKEEYVLHWSSSHADNGYGPKGIFSSRTKDFHHFTVPKLLYREKENGVIDSAIYEQDGMYYMFLKHEGSPARIMELCAPHVDGPYTMVEKFDERMALLEQGQYEAPTAVPLDDGQWCLFLDYYGVPGAGQGYVPFVAPDLKSGDFVRSDQRFSFPYGFKHGTILKIGEEEYRRIRNFDFSEQ